MHSEFNIIQNTEMSKVHFMVYIKELVIKMSQCGMNPENIIKMKMQHIHFSFTPRNTDFCA